MVATSDLCGLQAGPSGAVPSQLPLLASGTELDLPLSWAGKLWVACSLVMSSILASGCLDQFNFRHVTPIVCFGFISAPVFPSTATGVNTESPVSGKGSVQGLPVILVHK